MKFKIEKDIWDEVGNNIIEIEAENYSEIGEWICFYAENEEIVFQIRIRNVVSICLVV